MDDRPKSWWRELLGYRSILVIDSIEVSPRNRENLGLIKDYHYEWQWRPFGNKKMWVSGPWTKFN